VPHWGICATHTGNRDRFLDESETETKEAAMDYARVRSRPQGRRLFREGSPTIGVGISDLFGPSLFSVLAAAGADYGFVDMEHTGFSYRDVSALISSARAADLPVIIRPPEVSRSAVGRVLDLGADGVLAPRAGGVSGASALVRAARYRPIGDRGDDGRITTAYGSSDSRALADELNTNTIVIAGVETREDVDEIDEICTTPGIDGIWIGPADLTLALDVPGDFQCDTYRTAEERVIDSCRAHGMPFAIGWAATPAEAIEQARLGCFTLLTEDEVTLLGRAVSDYVTAAREGFDRVSREPS
jgi:2-keto-3-deoxy-L-rhamnonate aldolase RhmA